MSISMPIRTEIEILPGDTSIKSTYFSQVIITSKGITKRRKPGRINLGWSVKEVIGVAIVNPRGLKNLKQPSSSIKSKVMNIAIRMKQFIFSI